jgi:hypothetical protein
VRFKPDGPDGVGAGEPVDLGLCEGLPEGGGAAELAVGGGEGLGDQREVEVAVVETVDVEPGVGPQKARGAHRSGRCTGALGVGGERGGGELPPALGESGVVLQQRPDSGGGAGEGVGGGDERGQRDDASAGVGGGDPELRGRGDAPSGKAAAQRGPDGARGGDLAVDGAVEALQETAKEREVGALQAQLGGPGTLAGAARQRDGSGNGDGDSDNDNETDDVRAPGVRSGGDVR